MRTALKDFMILHSDRDVLSPAIERKLFIPRLIRVVGRPRAAHSQQVVQFLCLCQVHAWAQLPGSPGRGSLCPRALQRQLTLPVPFPTNPLGLKTLKATPLGPSTAPLLKNLSLPKQTPQTPSMLSSRPPSG